MLQQGESAPPLVRGPHGELVGQALHSSEQLLKLASHFQETHLLTGFGSAAYADVDSVAEALTPHFREIHDRTKGNVRSACCLHTAVETERQKACNKRSRLTPLATQATLPKRPL
jgi:hypothetical protein